MSAGHSMKPFRPPRLPLVIVRIVGLGRSLSELERLLAELERLLDQRRFGAGCLLSIGRIDVIDIEGDVPWLKNPIPGIGDVRFW